jgi:hypothetical protein
VKQIDLRPIVGMLNSKKGEPMANEKTPVDARGGVVSGRVLSVLAISFVGGVIALVIVWFSVLH